MDWQSLAIGGMFAVLGGIVGLLIKMYDMVHTMRDFQRKILPDWEKSVDRTRDLHIWHDHRDEDGVFSWYVRKSLEEKIGDLAKSIALLARHIEKLVDRDYTDRSQGL